MATTTTTMIAATVAAASTMALSALNGEGGLAEWGPGGTPVGLKHSSDRRETLPKRVSDDPRQVNFWPKRIFFAEIFRSRKSFYTFLAQFWRIYGETDLNSEFLAVFRSRWTYSEVCAIKKPQKHVRRRPSVWDASTPGPPVPRPPSPFRVIH